MLTQAEIDALLNGAIESDLDTESLSKGQAPTATDGQSAEEAKDKRVRPYNFWSPDRFSKDQMRAIELVHEDLAERLTTSLPAYLRTMFRPRLIHIEQGRFDEFAQEMPASTLYNILAFDPLPGRAVLIFSPEVTWVILERLLGGSGRTPPPASKPLTDIGQTLIRSTVEFMLNDIKAAWSKIVSLEPRLEDATVNNLWVTMLMRNARVVLVTFELLIQGVTGTMNLYIPLSMLKPVATALTPSAWVADHEQARPSDEIRSGLTRVITKVNLPLSVELGQAKLTIQELAALSKGDVLRLNTMVGQELNLKIGTRARYRVQPGAVGSRLAVRVTNMIEDQETQ